jgi:hypothetical protein
MVSFCFCASDSLTSNNNHALDDGTGLDEQVRYQWFWAGTQDESRRLSTDLRHAVKRHVVVKRIVPEYLIIPLSNEAGDAVTTSPPPENITETPREEEGHAKTGDQDQPSDNLNANADAYVKDKAIYTWDSLLDFNFSVQVCLFFAPLPPPPSFKK